MSNVPIFLRSAVAPQRFFVWTALPQNQCWYVECQERDISKPFRTFEEAINYAQKEARR